MKERREEEMKQERMRTYNYGHITFCSIEMKTQAVFFMLFVNDCCFHFQDARLSTIPEKKYYPRLQSH